MVTAAAGNTLLPPPRRTGNADIDLAALHEWANDWFQDLAVQKNIIGTVDALTAATADVLTRLAAAEAKLKAIADLAPVVGPINASFDAQQLADAYDKINAIIFAST